ncbi:MAG: hypothetical protein Q9227_007454 [Pyrenula ochraceoflavens]
MFVTGTEIEVDRQMVKRNLLTLSKLRPEPSNNRDQANYRYYCDDDARRGRWRLKDDPPESQRPRDYVLQSQRHMPHRALPNEQFQEWIDVDNGM